MTLYREFTDQESLDKAYNPSLGEPRGLASVSGWAARSAVVRGREGFRRIPFGPTVEEAINWHRPDAVPSVGAPVHLFIHGGYWRAFSANDHDFVAPAFTAAGYLVGIVDYALCPNVTIDEISRQIRAAIAWTARNVSGLGGNPARITISGHSAGGHLVGMAAVTDWEGRYALPADTVKAGMPISGLFDLHPFPYTYLQPKLQLDWAQVRRNSPILHVRPSPTRLMAMVGGVESGEFHRQSRSFTEAWNAAGNDGRCRILDGHDHFTILEDFADGGKSLHQDVLAFLNSA
ncbi:MAG: alpha/beta hydrolase [Geminicoccaceae bacterium]|nr:alpha/beta hydrolase [Geminicoccaceae bacterium]